MKSNYNYIYVLFILVVSSAVFFWFRGDHIIFGGDYLPIIRPINEFNQNIFSWLSTAVSGLGGYTGSLPEIFPYDLFTAFGSVLGFSIVSLQKILFYLILCVSGLSMFLLVHFLFEKSKNKNLAAVFAALFYMFNTYTMFFKWPDRFQSLFSYALLPLALAFYIKGLEKRNNFLYSVGIAFVFLFMAPSVTTPTYLVVVSMVLFSYFLFYNLFDFNREKLKKSILFSIKTIILAILFNFWWVPLYYYNIFLTNMGVDFFQTARSVESFGDTLGINSINTSFLNVFRIMGYWALDANDNGYYYYPLLSKVYTSFLFICISIFIPITVFSSSLVKKIDRKTRGLLLFFVALSVVSLFFIKGVHEPFGNINKWIFFNIPGFSIFRSQYEKFGTILVLGYSVLFGFMISYIYSYLKGINKIILGKIFIGIVFILFFMINMFPFWTGQYIQEQRGRLVTQRVAIPVYYNEAYNWLSESQLDKRLIIFPLSNNNYGSVNYQWGGANGNILSKLFSQSVVTKLFFDQANRLNNDQNILIKSLSLINIQYIFADDSRVPDITNKKDSKQINISPRGSINFVKEFDQLKFYKINSNNFLPHFYTPQTIITTSQSIDTLPEIVSQKGYKIRSAIYFNNLPATTTATSTATTTATSTTATSTKKATTSTATTTATSTTATTTKKATTLTATTSSSTSTATTSSTIFNPKELKKSAVNNTPVIEFKKVNPTKYTVVIHHAAEDFPLIFSESFHAGWKSYLADYKKEPVNFDPVDYKILDGNADDQATTSELNSFIGKGYISTVGDLKDKEIDHTKWQNDAEKPDYIEKYKIDFISKNFQGTIQNDNLSDGRFYDTWFQKSIDNNANHLVVNGYANSWNFDPNQICLDNVKCVKNADGSYDFEIIIEFWPQRLFYIGLFISGTTLVGCLGYFGWEVVRRRKGTRSSGSNGGNEPQGAKGSM